MFNKKAWQLAACCVATALLTTVTIVGVEGVLLQNLTGSASESVRFLRTMHLLKRNYNGDVDTHQLFDGAIKGMVESVGDPYTVYLNRKRAASSDSSGSRRRRSVCASYQYSSGTDGYAGAE